MLRINLTLIPPALVLCYGLWLFAAALMQPNTSVDAPDDLAKPASQKPLDLNPEFNTSALAHYALWDLPAPTQAELQGTAPATTQAQRRYTLQTANGRTTLYADTTPLYDLLGFVHRDTSTCVALLDRAAKPSSPPLHCLELHALIDTALQITAINALHVTLLNTENNQTLHAKLFDVNLSAYAPKEPHDR
ncbi:MAG: hypothetical protein JXK05_04910 [Campylobacterales bacterium]|nr:hypothetical protein [Campylobacterales bacterium]